MPRRPGYGSSAESLTSADGASAVPHSARYSAQMICGLKQSSLLESLTFSEAKPDTITSMNPAEVLMKSLLYDSVCSYVSWKL